MKRDAEAQPSTSRRAPTSSRETGRRPADVPGAGGGGRRRRRRGRPGRHRRGPPRWVRRICCRCPFGWARLDPAFDGFRIAVVSDIHLGPLLGRAHTERIVRMINETEPDLVAVVGDLVDGTVDAARGRRGAAAGSPFPGGAFFVTGNHEYFVDDTAAWLQELERLGLHVLRNENTRIRRGVGRVRPRGGQRHRRRVSLRRPGFRPGADRGEHDRARRSCWPTNRSRSRRPPSTAWTCSYPATPMAVRCGRSTTSSSLAQPSLAGLSTVNDTQLYVTRGAGFWGPPVRIGAPPDISVLSLHSH